MHISVKTIIEIPLFTDYLLQLNAFERQRYNFFRIYANFCYIFSLFFAFCRSILPKEKKKRIKNDTERAAVWQPLPLSILTNQNLFSRVLYFLSSGTVPLVVDDDVHDIVVEDFLNLLAITAVDIINILRLQDNECEVQFCDTVLAMYKCRFVVLTRLCSKIEVDRELVGCIRSLNGVREITLVNRI